MLTQCAFASLKFCLFLTRSLPVHFCLHYSINTVATLTLYRIKLQRKFNQVKYFPASCNNEEQIQTFQTLITAVKINCSLRLAD